MLVKFRLAGKPVVTDNLDANFHGAEFEIEEWSDARRLIKAGYGDEADDLIAKFDKIAGLTADEPIELPEEPEDDDEDEEDGAVVEPVIPAFLKAEENKDDETVEEDKDHEEAEQTNESRQQKRKARRR